MLVGNEKFISRMTWMNVLVVEWGIRAVFVESVLAKGSTLNIALSGGELPAVYSASRTDVHQIIRGERLPLAIWVPKIKAHATKKSRTARPAPYQDNVGAIILNS